MGFIVLCSPVLIPLIIISFVLGLKVDEWFNHQPSRQKRCYYYDVIDDYDDFSPSHFDDAASYDSGSSDSPLYGGLPYGDGELFLVDNEDLIDQMDF